MENIAQYSTHAKIKEKFAVNKRECEKWLPLPA
jgi:hypothetical protein